MNKNLGIFLVVVVAAAAIAGGYLYPKFSLSGSSAGSTFASQKIAQQIVTTATDTQFAILNTDGSDRTITSAEAFLANGAATTTLYGIQCATSTVATGLNGNTNYIFNTTFPVTYGTTTSGSNFFVSTSSPGVVSTTTSTGSPAANYVNNFARVWKSGSYLVCKSTTAGGGSNSNLLDAAMTGFMAFSYKGQ